MSYVLGLDLGIASVGWSIVEPGNRINYLEDLIRIDIQRIATHFFVFFFGAFIKIFIRATCRL